MTREGRVALKLQGGDNVNGQQTDILGSCCYTFHLTHTLVRMMYKSQMLQTVSFSLLINGTKRTWQINDANLV